MVPLRVGGLAEVENDCRGRCGLIGSSFRPYFGVVDGLLVLPILAGCSSSPSVLLSLRQIEGLPTAEA